MYVARFRKPNVYFTDYDSMKHNNHNLKKEERTEYKYINPLDKKRRPLYLKTQFVPRSKHFSSRL